MIMEHEYICEDEQVSDFYQCDRYGMRVCTCAPGGERWCTCVRMEVWLVCVRVEGWVLCVCV
jgi:hypothetical protein